jgi:hypothetical protein
MSKIDKIAIVLGIAILAFHLVAHPHYGKCHNTDLGYTCTLTHYTYGFNK